METTRRGFFGLILGATAAGTLLTNKSVAQVILQYPEDPISGTVRRAREMLTLHEMLKAEKDAAGIFRLPNMTEKQWREHAERRRAFYAASEHYRTFLDTSDGLLGYMLGHFTEMPHWDQVSAVFDGHLVKSVSTEYFDENPLRAMSHGVIPIFIAKVAVQVYKMPWDTQRMPNFDRFADKYRYLIMGSASDEYRKRTEAIRRCHDANEEARMRREIVDWVSTRHQTDLEWITHQRRLVAGI